MASAPLYKAYRWIPLIGDVEVTGEGLRFLGHPLPSPQPSPGSPVEGQQTTTRAPIGLVASDQYLSDGLLRARVSFETVSANSIFELALIRDLDRRHLVTAGLGGASCAFSIREFGQVGDSTVENAPNRWTNHRGDGDRTFLKPGREYHLEVVLEGGQISLKVDDVPVVSALVGTLRGRACQVGAFFMNEAAVNIHSIEILWRKPKAFVAMQLDGAYDHLYQHVVREVCEAFQVLPIRADEMPGPGVIIEDIIREIEASRLVIADISSLNPNVYFEIGYARALGKPIILLARRDTKLPFDIAGFRVLFYEDTIGGKGQLDESLRRHMGQVLLGTTR